MPIVWISVVIAQSFIGILKEGKAKVYSISINTSDWIII